MKYDTPIPKPEYPRPQMVRSEWINLNGEWEFEIDHGNSGVNRKLFQTEKLNETIIVPFCPESKLSGVGYTDFMESVWYRREFALPDSWRPKRTLIHFGACDYRTQVWINGVSAGTHRGGYTSFTFDITDLLIPGVNTVTVHAEDFLRSGTQPCGKQSDEFYSRGCVYSRTTGIWQTVWLECVPTESIRSLKYIPDPENSCVHVEGELEGCTDGMRLEAKALYDGRNVGAKSSRVSGKRVNLTLEVSETHLWGPGTPNLYDLELTLWNQETCVDTVMSYFGLRSVCWTGNEILINGKPVFQRLILDQGYYPDGIYTAPSDGDLKRDIEISMGLGFNGARLHQKIFEQRYLYWADKLGYLVWEEHANWGLNNTTGEGLEQFLPEWLEAMKRDFSSPAIIGWCPFNETWDRGSGAMQNKETLRIVYECSKLYDKTRPVIDTSGFYHVITDIYDVHDYEQSPERFAAKFEPMKNGGEPYVDFPDRQKYEGQPYFVSEYGGVRWVPGGDNTGVPVKNEEEYMELYGQLTHILLSNPRICAFCFTQLYDVEQEVNGLYTYDRNPKFDDRIIRKINMERAAIEK